MANPISSLEGGIIGVAIGEGAAAAVEPVVEPAKQQVWEANPFRVLEPGLLAELVVQALVEYAPAAAQAKRSGFDGNKFRAMVEATFRAPGTAEALELWRRKRIDKAQMRHALHKAGLEEQYIEPVLELFGERLDPAVIANAVQQGFLANDGLLPAATPPDPSWTPADGPIGVPTEQVGLNDADGRAVSTIEEAGASGIDFDRLRVLSELAGLPPGEETLLDMWRRGIIGGSGYAQGLREGHTKTKWTAALSARFHQLLPAGVLVRLRLKGWITPEDFYGRMVRHGYTPAAANDWFLSEGRPAAPQQMATAVARGVEGPDGRPMDEAQFVKGIVESDIRPEWAKMLWGVRFAYPPLFQLNRLVQAGAIDAATGVSWAKKDRYAPEVIAALERYWQGGAGTSADPNVKKAQGQLWTRLHRSYIAGETDTTAAQDTLAQLGIVPPQSDEVLGLWLAERALAVKQLTAAQVKKAYSKAVTNPATGQPWTRADAVTRLIQMGYTFNDASTFLDE